MTLLHTRCGGQPQACWDTTPSTLLVLSAATPHCTNGDREDRGGTASVQETGYLCVYECMYSVCRHVSVCEGEAHMCTVFVQGSQDYLWLGEYPKDRDSMGVRSPHYVIPLSLI